MANSEAPRIFVGGFVVPAVPPPQEAKSRRVTNPNIQESILDLKSRGGGYQNSSNKSLFILYSSLNYPFYQDRYQPGKSCL